jgi:hypothetical protein
MAQQHTRLPKRRRAPQAEIRVMYIWVEEMTPVQTIIRTGRGLMMAADHNRNLDWVGASATFYPG